MDIISSLLDAITVTIFLYEEKLLSVLLSGLLMTLTLESTIDIGKQYVSILGSFQTPIKAVGGLMSLTVGVHYLPGIFMDQVIAIILYLGPWISSGLILAGYSFAVGNAVTDWSYLNDGFRILYSLSVLLVLLGLGYWIIADQIPYNLPNLLNKTQYYPETILNQTNQSV